MKLAVLAAAVLGALAAQEPSRADRWRADIQAAIQFVTATHPNLYTQIARDEFEAAAQNLDAALDAMTDYEAAVGLARLLALPGDAHTNLGLRVGLTGIRQYPIRVQWFDDGLYVTHASQPLIRALGKRVVRIGNLGVEEAYALARTLISHENASWARQRTAEFLVSPEVLHALRILPDLGPATYSIEESDGAVSDLVVSPVAATVFAAQLARPKDPLHLRHPAQNYWFDYLHDSGTIYVKYNVCAESPALSMAAFTREVLAFAEANPVERIVFDLRHNTGGNSAVIQPLIAALRQVARPSRGTYTIIGRLTFSSGLLNAIDLKRQGAVLVGQPTGGRPNAYGETRQVLLPNSQLVVSCSTRLFTIAGFPSPALAPDIAVPYVSADYFAERDPALDVIVAP